MEALEVTLRAEKGTRAVRRLRNAGHTPGVVYGHGKESVSVSVPTRQLETALRHGERFLDLGGDLSEKALIREVQWDAFGIRALHIDFTRVSADERVAVKVSIELRGEAPGANQGGMVEQLVHEVEIECPAAGIPDGIQADIRQLEVDQSISAGDIVLPEGVTMVTDASAVIVHCAAIRVEEGEEDAEDGGVVSGQVEPEVIGRKADDDEDASE